jgi:hypothetical protein
MAATTSGIVMNGPIPHICVILTATPERTPRYRTNPGPPADALAGAEPVPPGLPSTSAIVLTRRGRSHVRQGFHRGSPHQCHAAPADKRIRAMPGISGS